MSKKIYLLLLLLPLFTIKAQTCYIDHSEQHEGIWPDSATNFVSGTIGLAYNQNVTIRVPYDTIASGTHIYFTSFNLETSTNNWGLPPGLSLAGSPANFQFPANDSSCMVIYGTPTGTITVPTTYTLHFVIDVYGHVFSTSVPTTEVTTSTINYYKITINPSQVGIEKHNEYDFELGQNSPNPVANTTTIKYKANLESKIKFSVYNITGQKVIDREIQAQRGDNSYVFDASALENGVYLYSLEMNGQKQTRRMMVSK